MRIIIFLIDLFLVISFVGIVISAYRQGKEDERGEDKNENN